MKKKLLIILTIILSLSVILNLYFLQKSTFFSDVAKKRSVSHSFVKTAPYLQRQSLFEEMQTQNVDLLFLGDSITQRCEWQELFPDYSAINRGIDSDTTAGISLRLDTVIASNPDRIFIMMGINDLAKGTSTPCIVDNYSQVLDSLTTALPTSKIFVQSVLPVGEEVAIPSRDIQNLNKELEALCIEKNITFMNLFPLFCNDQQMLPCDYSVDGVHLTGEAYMIWKQEITTYLND